MTYQPRSFFIFIYSIVILQNHTSIFLYKTSLLIIIIKKLTLNLSDRKVVQLS